jgi:hypothetical protein
LAVVADQARLSDLQNRQFLLELRADFQGTTAKVFDLEAKISKPPMSGTGDPSGEQTISTIHRPQRSDKGEGWQDDSDVIKRDVMFHFPRADCPGFAGENPIEWIRKCNYYFTLHQVPALYKSDLATLQFHGIASDWYDAYLMDHDPLDWNDLVALVQK